MCLRVSQQQPVLQQQPMLRHQQLLAFRPPWLSPFPPRSGAAILAFNVRIGLPEAQLKRAGVRLVQGRVIYHILDEVPRSPRSPRCPRFPAAPASAFKGNRENAISRGTQFLDFATDSTSAYSLALGVW